MKSWRGKRGATLSLVLAVVLCCLLTASAASRKGMPRSWERRENPLVSIDVEGVDEIHLAYQGDPPPMLVLSNRTDGAISLPGTVRVLGFGGTTFGIDAFGELAPHGCRRLPFGRDLPKGPWLAEAELDVGSTNVIAETRFAVVRRREATPPSPPGVFRAGFNYFMSRYTDADNEKCLKSIVQAGAKIVRASIGAQLSEVQKTEGVFDWTKPDSCLELLERHGLALDTIIYSTPDWARDAKHAGDTGRYLWVAPARRGVYRDFCRALASRYGTRIDWYENGNEWDLVPAERITPEEAIEMQREVYEGIKAGCPDAKVLPNGWGQVHSDVIPHRTQRGLHERVMCEGYDFYDAHPVHQHGPYREFRRRMTEFFAWRRKRGIDNKPWYSNETAQTTTFAGEAEVAGCVWQKIVFAWTHGSVDYIWYNLRASGFEPGDGEQGFGVMTGDFYPRAPYAAFAGLTSCFEGLSPSERVYEGVSREIYRFSGDRKGKRVQVLVGWDIRAQTNVSVRVRTDAARAFAVDIFDNRRELPISGGSVALTFGKVPAALLLEDVAEAVPAEADMRCGELPDVMTVSTGERGYRFRLNDYDSVFEIYKADPLHFDRIWKGAKRDLSVDVVLLRDGSELGITARSTDEALKSGDCLVVIVDGEVRRFPMAEATDTGAAFSARIDFPAPESVIEVRLEDDDGQGVDGWMTTGRFRLK